MRVVLIPDKFKGSLTSEEVIAALTRGIRRVHPDAQISTVIASDGGDGFLNAIAHAVPAEEVVCPAVDPLMRDMQARYLLNRQNSSAYIELAECSGMVLLDPAERDPLRTTTLGTGMQIRDALGKGALKIYIGLGGSATNDGGIGIAHGLGFRFQDSRGKTLEPVGGNLGRIRHIHAHHLVQGLENIEFYAVNDVDNPLLGERGATRVYAAQKGAGEKEIRTLEEGMEQLVSIVQEVFGAAEAGLPGAGAAGGAAFGLRTFFNSRFVKGIDFMLRLTNSEVLFEGGHTDLLITGEGAIDEQTLRGKLIHGVADLGKRYAVPVIAVCGKLELEPKAAEAYGLEAILEIRDKAKPVSYSMEHAADLIEEKICDFLRHRRKPE